MVVVPSDEALAGTPVSGIIGVDTVWREVDSPIWVEGSVVLPWGVNLTIEPGVEVRFDGNYTIRVDGNFTSEGTAAKRIVYRSNSTTPGFGDWYKIGVGATSRVNISYSDFMHAYNAIDLAGQYNLSLSNINFSQSLIGIVSLNSSAIKVINSTFSNIYQGMHLANRNNSIVNCTFSDLYFGMHLVNHSNLVVNSRFSDVYYGLILSNHSNVIRNNTFVGGKQAVDIYCNDIFWNCSSNIITGNRFTSLEGGVYLRNNGLKTTASLNIVRNNSFLNVDGPISFYNEKGASERNVIGANTMTHGAYGIFLKNSINNTVVDNRVTDFREGIALYGSGENKVVRNVVAKGVDGIVVRDTNRGNHITFNNIVSFIGCGVALVEGSSDNLIHHNNLLDSGFNGCDAGVSNRWDNGYPSGGNFWSDYVGTDQFMGPGQNVSGFDGIGDTPYDTRGNGRDRYPLMWMPFGNIPIEKLHIDLTGQDFENVTISWNVSWPQGNASFNITRFDIYRSSIYNDSRDGYQVIGSVPNYTNEFVDFKAGEGNSSNYFYYVCSLNETNVSFCSLNQVGKFTRPLERGWNLVSVPLIQEDWTVSEVLKTTTMDRILTYDRGDRERQWKEYSLAKPYHDLYELDITKAYWVHVTSDCNLTVVGTVPIVTEIPHSDGWNFVGYPSFTNKTIASALAGKVWDRVEGFNNSSNPYHLKELLDTDIMTAGEGYWVHFSTSGVWRVRN
jgi:parallel beta-helix repeat protein